MKNTKKRNLKIRKYLILACLVIALLLIIKAIVFVAEYFSVPDAPDDGIDYPVRGIDVSHYQGDIDWPTLADQNIAFVFIKATEGSSHVDKNFEYNWEGATDTHLKVGAYHFLSFESSGETQAENFISNVPKESSSLPPVIDLELYGDFISNHPSQETVDSIIQPMLQMLEDHYDKKPIIYTTSALYEEYVKGNYDNDIWLADLSFPETLPDGSDWKFLQYSFEGKLEGYSGYLPHLDLNVYNGSKLDFVREY